MTSKAEKGRDVRVSRMFFLGGKRYRSGAVIKNYVGELKPGMTEVKSDEPAPEPASDKIEPTPLSSLTPPEDKYRAPPKR